MLKHVKHELEKDIMEATIEILQQSQGSANVEAEVQKSMDNQMIDEKNEEMKATVANPEEKQKESMESSTKSETVEDLKTSSTATDLKKTEPVEAKEATKSNLGLWFNLDLRKQIHITPKGWELRRG